MIFLKKKRSKFPDSRHLCFYGLNEKTTQDVNGNASSDGFLVCFFHRSPFLWCWMLWIMTTHQNQVKLQLINHRSENQNLFQNIVLDNQC